MNEVIEGYLQYDRGPAPSVRLWLRLWRQDPGNKAEPPPKLSQPPAPPQR